ncbi:hypothetical protein N0V82_004368 [Gnomoniopsis sp. IMI 355080]|nr:hypothetical protein N0V82_004368 [Gnomoniopsis sp. IMI 355080]
MVNITMRRGFKVPLDMLDGFLTTNGIPEEHERLCMGNPPFYGDESDKVTTLLRHKTGGADAKTRLFMPYRQGFGESFTAYIAYDWIAIFAQRKIKPDDLSKPPSAGFDDLRREILSHGTNGAISDDEERFQNALWIIVTDGQNYNPPELIERYKNVKCDKCEKTVEDGSNGFVKRQRHRRDVHGSRESINPLPEHS